MASVTSNSATNFIRIVWLDRTVNRRLNQRYLTDFQRIDPQTKTFETSDACIDYFQQEQESNSQQPILLITSGSLAKETIPTIHGLSSLLTFFIFCMKESDYVNFKSYSKLRGIYTVFEDLFNSVDIFIYKSDDITDISVFRDEGSTPSGSPNRNSTSNDSSRDLQTDQARFLWNNSSLHFMRQLKNDDDETEKKEMIDECSVEMRDTPRYREHLEEFESQHVEKSKRNSIYWYTKNSFVYRYTNDALRHQKLAAVYPFRFMIKSMCSRLEAKHREFVENYSGEAKKKFYRGQCLEKSAVKYLENSVNNLMSFNSFVSTSEDPQTARKFMNNRHRPNLCKVFFEINVDMTVDYGAVFANIADESCYHSEKEVLFSIGTIFRIDSVEFVPSKRFYRIQLILVQQIQASVHRYIEQTYQANGDSLRISVLFGKLSYEMGEERFALNYFKKLCEKLDSNEREVRAVCLNNIGVCYRSSKQLERAEEYFKKSLAIYQQTTNKRGLGSCYHNLASVSFTREEYDEAQSMALQALENRRQFPLEKALTLDLLGMIKLINGSISSAADNFQQAFELRLKHLQPINPKHPELGTSQKNLGLAAYRSNQLTIALTHFNQAAEIFARNYPKKHSSIVEVDRYIERLKTK